MAISLNSLQRGSAQRPLRCVVYGTHGVGKTSFGAFAPEPIFLRFEDGLGLLDVATFDQIRTYDDLMQAFSELFQGEHQFQTVVLDTLDWLEPIVWAEACRANNWSSIEDAGYGKGYLAASDIWRSVMEALNDLRTERSMNVIMLAHTEVRRFDAPDSDPYDRYQPKLHKLASAIVQENVDAVFFMTYRVSLMKVDPKDKNSRKRGVGGGQRVIWTEERPSHLAKNRWRMPDQIDLPDDPAAMWPAIAQHIPYFQNKAA